MNISDKKSFCTNDKGEIDYTHGEFKCPDCGYEFHSYDVFYFFDEKKGNVLHCPKCNLYYPH